MSQQFVICPFCPLHCDDIAVDSSGNVSTDCETARSYFPSAINPQLPRIGSEQADWDQVAALIQQQLGKHQLETSAPIAVTTSGADLRTSRSLSRLQQESRILLSVESSSSESAMRKTIARDGIVSATLGDVRNHADYCWAIGDVTASASRFWNRVGDLSRHDSPSVTADFLSRLMCAYSAKDGSAKDGSDNDDSEVGRLAASLRTSKYSAIVLGENAFTEKEADAIAPMLTRLVWQANQSSRCVLVMLDASATLRSVVAWQTNRSISTITQVPLMRIGTPRADSQHVTLQIGGVDANPKSAELFLPTAVPGVHVESAVVRGDGTVTLPLVQFASTELPTTSEFLDSCFADAHEND